MVGNGSRITPFRFNYNNTNYSINTGHFLNGRFALVMFNCKALFCRLRYLHLKDLQGILFSKQWLLARQK